MAWEDVKNEMVNEKGLSEDVADQIGQFVSMQGEWTSPTFSCSRSTIVSIHSVERFVIMPLTSRWDGSGWATASGPQTLQEQTGLRRAHGYEAALQLSAALSGHRQGEVYKKVTRKSK